MTSTTVQDRIGILLNFLGEDVSKSLLENLPDTQAQQVRDVLQGMSTNPPEDYEVDEVLEEFDRFLTLISNEIAPNKKLDRSRPGADEDEAPTESTGDPDYDLTQLSVPQIVRALETENPRTIAIVLNGLDSELAASVLEEFENELGSRVFLHLQSPPTVPETVRRCIVEAAFAKGRLLQRQKPVDPTSAAIQRLAEMLRKMDRSSRAAMLETLRAEDEDTADAVAQKLYVFDDILEITDRSIQSLLGELDTATLAVALKDGEQAVTDKILSNMSKRARATMLEEIEYLGRITPEEQRIARQNICTAIAEMDAKGDLEMELA